MLKNVSLKPYNTFGIDAKADWLAEIDSEEQVLTIIDDLPDAPKLILGQGSNVLFLNDFRGTILHNNIKGKRIIDESDDEVTIAVKGGENWHDFVMWAVENNYGGIENLALIPGKVGTAPMQNIGAYGVEVKDVISEVKTINMKTCEPKSFSNADCEFGYRSSIFKKLEHKGLYFINEVVFKLTKRNHQLKTGYGAIQQILKEQNIAQPGLKDIANAVIKIRQSKLPDPKVLGNAGSFFKNPYISKEKLSVLQEKYPELPFYPTNKPNVFKVPAGWLIDKAGWKGKRFGPVGVHDKQALVLVNYGGATGQDVKQLADNIIADIQEKYDILFTPEVNFI
jgi:UDP-N-acetylmuramate dehydrogenase